MFGEMATWRCAGRKRKGCGGDRTGDGWIKTTSPHARIVVRCRSEKKADRSALQRFGRHDLDAEAAEADVSELAGCEQADR